MEHVESRPQATTRISNFNGTLDNFRSMGLMLLCLLPFFLAWDLTRRLLTLALSNDTFTHIPLIPMVSLFLLYTERRTIFATVSHSWIGGGALLIPGVLTTLAARFDWLGLSATNEVSLFVLGIILVWIGAYGMFLGTSSLRAGSFPLLFLLFMIPIPEPWLSHLIHFLQEESANATAVLFNLFGVPYLREDLIFSLPGMAIRVAEECSGIRSTLALMIMTVLAGHLFLKSTWKQVLVCLLVVPLSIAKNGLRIAVLSALAVYVDRQFLTGPIHHQFGGMIFFAAAFIPLALTFIFLQKTGRKRTNP